MKGLNLRHINDLDYMELKNSKSVKFCSNTTKLFEFNSKDSLSEHLIIDQSSQSDDSSEREISSYSIKVKVNDPTEIHGFFYWFGDEFLIDRQNKKVNAYIFDLPIKKYVTGNVVKVGFIFNGAFFSVIKL